MAIEGPGCPLCGSLGFSDTIRAIITVTGPVLVRPVDYINAEEQALVTYPDVQGRGQWFVCQRPKPSGEREGQ